MSKTVLEFCPKGAQKVGVVAGGRSEVKRRIFFFKRWVEIALCLFLGLNQ